MLIPNQAHIASNILPRRNLPRIGQRESREPQTVIHIPRRHRGILRSNKHLPPLIRRRTRHEPIRVPAVEGIMRPRLTALVGEGSDRRAGRDECRMGLREAQSTAWVDVDLLAAGDFNVLYTSLVHFTVDSRVGTWLGITKALPPGAKTVWLPGGQLGTTWVGQ